MAALLVALSASSFVVLSGSCRVDALCVQEPRSGGSCNFTVPSSLPLAVKDWRVRRSDVLLVNGVTYNAESSGPEGVLPEGELHWWVGNITGRRSQFKLCRPPVPDYWYWVLHFSYVTICVTSFLVFLWSSVLTMIAHVLLGSAVAYALADANYSWVGYSQRQCFLSTCMESPFDESTVTFGNWTALYIWMVLVPPFAIIQYVRLRRYANRRALMIEAELRACLEAGHIRLLSVSWLLKQPPGYVLERRQKLPEKALVPTKTALKWLSSGHVGVLSYRWLTAAHPDPERWHMNEVCAFLSRSLKLSEMAALAWQGGVYHKPKGLFWDYASLHQKNEDGEKTEEEKDAFSKALKYAPQGLSNPCLLPATSFKDHHSSIACTAA